MRISMAAIAPIPKNSNSPGQARLDPYLQVIVVHEKPGGQVKRVAIRGPEQRIKPEPQPPEGRLYAQRQRLLPDQQPLRAGAA